MGPFLLCGNAVAVWSGHRRGVRSQAGKMSDDDLVALLAFSRLFFDGRRIPCSRVGLVGPGVVFREAPGARTEKSSSSRFCTRCRERECARLVCFPLSQRASECVARKGNVLDKQTGNHWKVERDDGTRNRDCKKGLGAEMKWEDERRFEKLRGERRYTDLTS